MEVEYLFETAKVGIDFSGSITGVSSFSRDELSRIMKDLERLASIPAKTIRESNLSAEDDESVFGTRLIPLAKRTITVVTGGRTGVWRYEVFDLYQIRKEDLPNYSKGACPGVVGDQRTYRPEEVEALDPTLENP